MLFGKVTGTVVATQKDEKLEGLRFHMVEVIDVKGEKSPQYVVAADSVGAGVGELVLFATGSSARQTKMTDAKPVDAVIMAVVDTWELEGKVIYDKFENDKVKV